MATILAFQRDPGKLPTVLPPGHTAQVYFYTGVRYERDAVETAPVQARKKSKARLARPIA